MTGQGFFLCLAAQKVRDGGYSCNEEFEAEWEAYSDFLTEKIVSPLTAPSGTRTNGVRGWFSNDQYMPVMTAHSTIRFSEPGKYRVVLNERHGSTLRGVREIFLEGSTMLTYSMVDMVPNGHQVIIVDVPRWSVDDTVLISWRMPVRAGFQEWESPSMTWEKFGSHFFSPSEVRAANRRKECRAGDEWLKSPTLSAFTSEYAVGSWSEMGLIQSIYDEFEETVPYPRTGHGTVGVRFPLKYSKMILCTSIPPPRDAIVLRPGLYFWGPKDKCHSLPFSAIRCN
ncbi:hypothetical protein AAP_01291 [Ascosphaera apis ARSEF 7405]|uniref:Uncharacterized protein n=1 Tax=Ascosphaera apis ARSEF 7405 TaxID=392613 RepID=A0A168BQU8_9EURO|nr:hypothetical protein AAP_01291 [Ascosphaera apis ARSEF 7405]